MAHIERICEAECELPAGDAAAKETWWLQQETAWTVVENIEEKTMAIPATALVGTLIKLRASASPRCHTGNDDPMTLSALADAEALA